LCIKIPVIPSNPDLKITASLDSHSGADMQQRKRGVGVSVPLLDLLFLQDE
jgi:hypothetical protein